MDNQNKIITKRKKLIAYCGLCCLDCFGYVQKIPNFARDLRKELRASKYAKFAGYISRTKFGEVFRDYDKCYQVLGAMVRFRCRRGCREGGGNPACVIRKCCIKKDIAGCWLCAEFETCKKLDALKGVHGDGHVKNLRMLNKKGEAAFLKRKRYW